MNFLLKKLFEPHNHTVFVDDKHALTGNELIRRVNICRGVLKNRYRVKPGDRIAPVGTSNVSFFVWVYASWCEGTTVIPVDKAYPAAYIERMLHYASTTIDTALLPDGTSSRDNPYHWSGEQIAIIPFTSGSTGTPSKHSNDFHVHHNPKIR